MNKKVLKPLKQTGDSLFSELSQLIEQSRRQLSSAANSVLTILFWQIGRRINDDILQNKRADYGKRIVVTVSQQLEAKYGSNFEEKNLRRMMQFSGIFTEKEIVVTLSRQLSWSHFLALLPLKKETARMFYAQKVILENWGVRELREAIARKEFERNAIAQSQLPAPITTPEHLVFKDPYFLDFLGLKDNYLENDLEAAILKELEHFILELLCKGLHNNSYAYRFLM